MFHSTIDTSQKVPTAPPDARAYLSVVDCPAFLQAVADGNIGAAEEFHNDGVGRLNKVTMFQYQCASLFRACLFVTVVAGNSQLL
jgi:hypothetical protein